MESGSTPSDARFELVLEVFNLSDSNYPEGILDFARDDRLAPGFRSALIYLAIKGKYPNSSQINALISRINASEFEDAIASVRRKSSYRDRRRLLVPAEGTLVDVTRYSRTAEMSGIPRVVRNFATSQVVKGSAFGVWSDQVFGPVQITREGFVYFHRKVWGNSRNTHHFYYLIRKLFFSKTPKMARMRLLSLFLKALRRVLFGRLLLKMVDLQAPKACYIINPRNLVIPEVPDSVNSELLRVWIENAGLQEVRCIVHDLLPLTHPEFFPKHAYSEHEEYVKLLRVCSTLVVGTPVLAKELAERLNLSEVNQIIKVLALPVSPQLISSESTGPNHPILTFVGGYQARKGLRGLVDFLEAFNKSQIDFKVAVIGAPNLLSGHDEGRLYSRLLSHPEIYEVHDTLSDSKFGALIKSSSAVLYISSAEGYGLPVLEALALDVPVIAARTPVNEHFRAEYGGIHFLSDSYSADDLTALNEIAVGGPLREKLKASIKSERLPLDVEKWAKAVLSI